jgi:hypothetical protein
MKRLMKRAALKAVKKAAGDVIGQVGTRIFSDFEGQFELKNGRTVAIKSVGTVDNPVFQLSVTGRSRGERVKKAITKLLAFAIGCIGGMMLINLLFDKNK